MITSISTLNMSREDWLTERKKGIGGSDAAGILGLSPWASPFSVWADKTGRLPDKEDNEAMRQGRDLEEYVASRWSEATGKKVRRDNHIIRNSDYPFALANIDRRVVGENAGLELKTTSVMNLKKFKNGEYPATYYAQVTHYLAVTGADRWYLGVLVLNQGFYEYTIERDEDEIAALMDAEESFWRYVEADTPPPLDGGEATTAALSTIYADTVPADEMELYAMDDVLREITDYKASIKTLETAVAERENQIKLMLGEQEIGRCGSFRVTWKAQTKNTFDAKAYASAHPETDLAPYYKTSSYRTFKITEVKEK